MKDKIRILLARIKNRKAYILYGLLIALLLGWLANTFMTTYGAIDQNRVAAAQRSQLVVFDLESGEKVDVHAIAAHAKANPNKPQPEPEKPKAAQISFIISGLGIGNADNEKALSLPKDFILAFSPYSETSLEQSKTAADSGHSVLVELPVEMQNPQSQLGALTLTSVNTQFRNLSNLDAVLSKVYQPAGVLSPQHDLFTRSEGFAPVLQVIGERSLYIAYAGDSENIEAQARDNDTELVKVDAVITTADIEKQLTALEELARKGGYAVALLTEPTTENLAKLAKWQEGLEKKNISLISSSDSNAEPAAESNASATTGAAAKSNTEHGASVEHGAEHGTEHGTGTGE